MGASKNDIAESLSVRAILIVLVIALVASIVRLAAIWSGACENGLIADDAFYYFKIARNIADGHGVTFDGLFETNGFHPLWLLLILPFFLLTDDLWIPVRLALTMSVFFDIISGAIIVSLARRIARNGRTAIWAGALWFLSPLTALTALRGLEASVSAAAVLATVLLLIRASNRRFSLSSAVLCGVGVGLAGLARTDNLISLGCAVAVFAFLAGRWLAIPLLRAIPWLLCAGAMATFVVLPWLLWNEINFSNIVQVSGLVKLHTHGLFGALPTEWSSPISSLRSVAHGLLAPTLFPTRFVLQEEFRSSVLTPVAALSLLAVYMFPPVIAIRQFTGDRTCRTIAATIVCFLLVHTILFGFIWRAYATWYGHPYWGLLTILTAVALSRMMNNRTGLGRFGRWCTLAVVLLVFGGLFLIFVIRNLGGSHDSKMGARIRLESAAAGGSGTVTVGAFNAGVLGYISSEYPDVRVVNLDGLVNNRVYEAIRQNRYRQYVESTIDVLAEPPERAAPFLTPSDVELLKVKYRRQKDGLWWRQEEEPAPDREEEDAPR